MSGTLGTRSCAMRGSTSDDPCRVQRLRRSMRSGASGVACLDAFFAVSATRARGCRLYSALSIIAPPVNVLRRTRRKPSTIKGAAPDGYYRTIYGGSRRSASSHQPLPRRLLQLAGTRGTNKDAGAHRRRRCQQKQQHPGQTSHRVAELFLWQPESCSAESPA